MKLSLFLSHFRASRGGIIAWASLWFVMGLFLMYLYPTIKQVDWRGYAEAMPEALRRAFGMMESGSLLQTWVTQEFLGWWPLALSIYAIFAAGGIVAREVERGTIDLILSHPLSRYSLVISKLAVLLAGLAALSLASLAGLALGLLLIQEEANLWGFFLALAQGMLLGLAVGAYSLLFSCIFLDPKKTLTASGILTGGLWILNFAAPSFGPLKWVDKLSLFHYYKAPEIVANAQPDWVGLALYLGLAGACIVASLIIFERRDLSL